MERKLRYDALDFNAANKRTENSGPFQGAKWFQKVHLQQEPVWIASTENIGTSRVRANHLDAAIDMCAEQEQLKAKKMPL